ncbi:ribonuclease HII [Nocardioides sp. GY 10127]|uniref:ribonuclease HII n=1 Tax=Nocardioides sp. GY 10127 TaxID=2569762 RepID=UPI0010A8D427|nr:ribonuclease HII [Nocardioides sp. GY 10127]TIC86395.1 ribonuclease HII [Nocardioides sp. GY 10127]
MTEPAEPGEPVEPGVGVPTHALEDEVLAATGASRLAALDEVGRGAAAGELVVCAVVPGPRPAPEGLADSKLLSAAERARLETVLLGWVEAHAFGAASAAEIDDLGMARCLTLAATRALAGLPQPPDHVLLDGPHDYVGHPWQVTARAKADRDSIAVAAASVLAKEHRDRRMRALAETWPGYGFEENVGYLSGAHDEALGRLGPTPEHRTSWRFMESHPQWEHARRGVVQLSLFGG